MIEIITSRRFDNDLRRRWFSDDYFDLIVWENQNKEIVKFELCYNKLKDEHAYVWEQQTGQSHFRVDDGEGVPDKHKMSPIFMPDGLFDREDIKPRFLKAGENIDRYITGFVAEKLSDCRKSHQADF